MNVSKGTGAGSGAAVWVGAGLAGIGGDVPAGGGTIAGKGAGLSWVDGGGSGVDTAVGEGAGSAWVQAITRTKQTHILINECLIHVSLR